MPATVPTVFDAPSTRAARPSAPLSIICVAHENTAGTINAREDWWGCNAGPGAPGCTGITGAVDYTPWLTFQFDAARVHDHDRDNDCDHPHDPGCDH